MSIHKKTSKNDAVSHVVQYRDQTGQQRSKSFRRRRDAERFDQQVKDAKTGQSTRLDAGRETLDEYVAGTWALIYAATLAAKTVKRYTQLYDGLISPALARTRCANSTPRSSVDEPTNCVPTRPSNRPARR